MHDEHEPTSHPLSWPMQYPRVPAGARLSDARFRTKEIAPATKKLRNEISRVGAKEGSIVISTNLPVRNDGLPYASRKPTDPDPGVAVYWIDKRDGDAMAMACDLYDSIIGNMRAITLTIEALRTVSRHGGHHMMRQAFLGFRALPPPATEPTSEKNVPWWDVLGVPRTASITEIKHRYRELMKDVHPDTGGGDEVAMRINDAYSAAKKSLDWP